MVAEIDRCITQHNGKNQNEEPLHSRQVEGGCYAYPHTFLLVPEDLDRKRFKRGDLRIDGNNIPCVLDLQVFDGDNSIPVWLETRRDEGRKRSFGGEDDTAVLLDHLGIVDYQSGVGFSEIANKVDPRNEVDREIYDEQDNKPFIK